MSVRMMMQGHKPAGGGGTPPSVVNSNTATATGTSCTLASFTVSGTNRLLLVAVANANTARIATGVTFNGTAMTKVGQALNSGGAQRSVTLWALVAPAATTADVVATMADVDGIALTAVCLEGVDQSTPYGTIASATGTSATPSVNASSASGELVVDAVSHRSTSTGTPGANQTLIESVLSGTNLSSGMSSEGGDTTVTMSWSMGASDRWATVALPVKPA